MNEKIIFLDFDGVFILNDIINKNCIINLNYIIKETNAKIVITSDWRNNRNRIELKRLFNDWGINGVIDGVTDNLWPVGGHISFIEKYRRNEIDKYIKENDGRIIDYVIIDDLELYNSFYTDKNDRFFNTLFYKGITKEIADKIIDKLK